MILFVIFDLALKNIMSIELQGSSRITMFLYRKFEPCVSQLGLLGIKTSFLSCQPPWTRTWTKLGQGTLVRRPVDGVYGDPAQACC